MTKEQLAKIVKKAKKGHDFDIFSFRCYDDLMLILNDIQEQDDTLCFDLICWPYESPFAIQIFTDVEFKGKNYSVIIDFEMPYPENEDDLINILWEEYGKALENRKLFNS